MSLRRSNLNMLPVLDALLRHRNVTQAGREVGLSQSATSHVLLRLREHFGDDLLVPSGRKMMLTHRARALAAPLQAALETIARLLETERFDPASAVRSFKIGTSDYIGALILPRLMQDIEQAEGLVIDLDWTDRDVGRKLRSGELDMAILPRGILDEDLHSEPLFEDELVVIAAKTNAAVKDRMTVSAFLGLPYVSFVRDKAEVLSVSEQQLLRNRLRPNRRVVVSEFMLLPHLIASTNYITILHRRLAEAMCATASIRIVGLPFKAEPVRIDLYWSHLADTDVGHKWLRERIVLAREKFAATSSRAEQDRRRSTRRTGNRRNA